MKELTSPTASLAAFPEECRLRAPEFHDGSPVRRCLAVRISLLRPHHSLELPAGRVDRTGWSRLVSHSAYFLILPTLIPGFHLRSVQGMGVAGPRAPYLLHLLHRYAQFTHPLPLLTQPPDQTPRAVSSVQPHLILRTRARRRRCITYQSHSSIMLYTIEGGDKKGSYLLREYCTEYTM